MNKSNDSDLLIMLISSDWFAKYLELFFSDLKNDDKLRLQSIARASVKSILNNVDSYWDVSFDNERIESTKSNFIDEINSRLKSSTFKKSINKYFSVLDEHKSIFSFCWILTEKVASGVPGDYKPFDDEYLFAAITKGVLLVKKVEDNTDFEEEALKSNTEWDTFLREITPDLPSYLPDFLLDFLDRNQFKIFIELMRKSLTPEQFQKMLDWFAMNVDTILGQKIGDVLE